MGMVTDSDSDGAASPASPRLKKTRTQEDSGDEAAEGAEAAVAPIIKWCTFRKEHPDGSREYTAAAGDVCDVGERSIFLVELPDVDELTEDGRLAGQAVLSGAGATHANGRTRRMPRHRADRDARLWRMRGRGHRRAR